MPRSFSGKALRRNLDRVRDPLVGLRVLLVVLVAANLLAALYAFRPWAPSPEQQEAQILDLRQQLLQRRNNLQRVRTVSTKVESGRHAGDSFIASHFLERRAAYSIIITELLKQARASNMLLKDQTFNIEPIEGSNDLSVLRMTVRFEGTYRDLLALVSGLDKSAHFLIIENLAAAPQQNSRVLDVVLTLEAFVREEARP